MRDAVTESRVYVGSIRHRRRTPREHAFSYRIFMLYLDLAELPSLFDSRWFWSAALDAGLYGPLFRTPACPACKQEFAKK